MSTCRKCGLETTDKHERYCKECGWVPREQLVVCRGTKAEFFTALTKMIDEAKWATLGIKN